MIEEIFSLLKNQAHSLAVAESCTGGALAHEITSFSGISEVFLGSITAYSNQAKEEILHVQAATIQKHGAVSEQVAIVMAVNCRRLFSSTWALSTTGIAGPTGATIDKPVGTVWIGISGPNLIKAQKFIFSDVSRREHQQKTVQQALMMLKNALTTKN